MGIVDETMMDEFKAALLRELEEERGHLKLRVDKWIFHFDLDLYPLVRGVLVMYVFPRLK